MASFRSLASDMGVSTSGLAIAWLLAQDEHIVPIPGTRSVDHLNELASGATIDLSESDQQAIDKALPIINPLGNNPSAPEVINKSPSLTSV